MKTRILFFLVSFFIFSCGSDKPENGLALLDAGRYEGYIKNLSSDDFLGRKPFTAGETKTLDFLQQELEKIGVSPGNGDSYLQQVPLVSITCKADPVMTVRSAKSSFDLKGLDEYVLWTQHADGAVVKDNELVFAGFGVVAPEYNWNDYADIDVKDKIVVVLVNDPGFGGDDSSFFKGNTMTYYGRWTYKYEEAARQGAKGCLVIHDTAPASYPFAVVQNSWNTSKFYLGDSHTVNGSCAVEGWLSLPALKKLFAAGGLNYEEQFAAAHKRGFRAVPMNLSASTNVKASAIYNSSNNVVGIIPGSKRPEEYIIYSAHWDHLGVGKPDVKGDSIYNGAMDNATGTSGLLELANVFMQLKEKPERSLVFLFVTSEEQGLLGSAYYAEHPVFPKEKTVANINIDGINAKGKVKDISLVGSGQSDLEDYLKEACATEGRYAAEDPSPEAGYYFRSDHFNFAKIGIPALYTHQGIDMVEGGKERGKKLADEYRAERYHKPADEYDAATWDLGASMEDLGLLFTVGHRLAMDSNWPQWKEGSEFKLIRDAYMNK